MKRLCLLAAVIALTWAPRNTVWAATRTWVGTTPDANTAANWGGTLPVAADIALFSNTVGASLVPNQSAPLAVTSLTFDATAFAYDYTIGATTLTIGSTGGPAHNGPAGTIGNITNNSTNQQIINVLAGGTLGIRGIVTNTASSGPLIINGSILPGLNFSATGGNATQRRNANQARNLNFTNAGTVYLNVDTNTLTGGTVLGGNGSAPAWAATLASNDIARTIFSGSGTVFAGNLGTAYTGTMFLEGTGKLQLTAGLFAGSAGVNGQSQFNITGQSSTLELNDITGSGIVMNRTNYNLENRTGSTPHIRNIAGNNILQAGTNNTATGQADWNTVGASGSGNWNIQSDSGKLTIAGGVMYATAATPIVTTVQLGGAGDGQIDSQFALYNTAFSNVVKSGAGEWAFSNIPQAGELDPFGVSINATATANQTSIFRGTMTVTAGTLALIGTTTLSGTTAVDIRSGAFFDVSGITSPTAGSLTLTSAQATIKGAGTFTGSLVAGLGNTIAPGDNLAVGTLKIAGNLSLTNSTLAFKLINTSTSNGGVSDVIAVGAGATGDLNLFGITTVSVIPTQASLGNGTYTLLTYGGALSGTLANFTLTGTPVSPRQTFNLDLNTANKLNMIVTGEIANLKWKGGVNGDIWVDGLVEPNSLNWDGTVADKHFYNGDIVTFDNTGTTFTPAISGTVSPGLMTFSNGIGSNYSISGGSISTIGAMVVTGAGNVTLTHSDLTVANITASGAGVLTVSLNGGITVSGAVQVSGTQTASFNSSSFITLGSFSNTSSSTVTFGGTSNLTVSGTFAQNGTGQTIISNTATVTIPTANVTTGKLVYQFPNVTSTATAFTGGGTVRNESPVGEQITFTGTLNGLTGTFEAAGPGTTALSGASAAFAGKIMVEGGSILRPGTTTAFGTIAPGDPVGNVIVANGGTLDLHSATTPNVGLKMATAIISIAGDGVGGIGALTDSSSGGTSGAVRSNVLGIILTADATVSSSGAGLGTYPQSATGFTLQGNNHSLTVKGGGEWDFVDAGETHLANVTLLDSVTYFIGTTSFGDAPGIITLRNDGGFGIQSSPAVTKDIVVDTTRGSIIGYNSNNSVNSQISINGTSLEVVIHSLNNNNNRLLTLGGKITGTGAFNVHVLTSGTLADTPSRTGTVFLTSNDNDFSGPITIGGGSGAGNSAGLTADYNVIPGNDRVTLSVGNGGTTGKLGSGAGIVTVNNLANLVFNRNDTFTIPNLIQGPGAVAVANGVVTLSNVNTYTGTTTVVVGTLIVTGSLDSPSIQVSSGGTLKGDGTVLGQVSVTAPGTLRGGASVGTLNLLNGFSTGAGATIAVEVGAGLAVPALTNSGGSSIVLNNSLLHVGGGVVGIDPGTLVSFNGTAGTFAASTMYSFLVADGVSTQVFPGIPTPSQFSFIGVNVDPNSVSLTNLDGTDGKIYLNFTTVAIPEPTAVLGLVALSLLGRRRLR